MSATQIMPIPNLLKPEVLEKKRDQRTSTLKGQNYRQRTSLPKVSPKMRLKLAEYARVKAIWWAARLEIDGGRCQFPFCLRRSSDTHHVAGRSGQNLLKVDSFRALCRPHHSYVHQHPQRAREMGLLL